MLLYQIWNIQENWDLVVLLSEKWGVISPDNCKSEMIVARWINTLLLKTENHKKRLWIFILCRNLASCFFGKLLTSSFMINIFLTYLPAFTPYTPPLYFQAVHIILSLCFAKSLTLKYKPWWFLDQKLSIVNHWGPQVTIWVLRTPKFTHFSSDFFCESHHSKGKCDFKQLLTQFSGAMVHLVQSVEITKRYACYWLLDNFH